MVTRDDVARLAGTSTAVVSYVVNNGPRPVAATTRERVERAIRETGYQPNRLARALRDRRSSVIGLIVPDSSNAFFAGLAQAIEEAAYRRGYFVMLGNSAEDAGRETGYVRAFLEHKVQGLALVSAAARPELTRETMKLLSTSQVPLVLIDRNHPVRGACVLLVDNVHGGRIATEHLLHEHGAPEVCCLAGPEGLALSDERVAGWQEALRAAGITPPGSWLRHSAFSRVRAREVMVEWLGGERAPKAVFVSSDEQAIGVLAAARMLKRRVPEDLAVVAFDGTPQAEYTQPGLTTVEQPLAEIGRCALERLVGTGARPHRRHVERLPTRLKVRASCGCRTDPWRCDAPTAPERMRSRKRTPEARAR